ncbi:hypothetical protein BDV59DRAFT_177060 [Aspergillus ambiguus]|uniref:uncharacterized protein n=1 Tax=Aspergillus ambiguus TaxID=176160 RepID=UPI003CCCC27F
MTTTSALAVSAMEVPGIDDTMEMASPYQGHADDFDIDLDVMEDHVSTTDKDMMGDDDFQDASHDMGFEPDGANDADMMDDVAEPTMVDADEHYHAATDSIDMQYSGEKSYEAEMLEDDYYEDIDAPVPDSHDDGLPSHEYHSTDHVQDLPITEEPLTADPDADNTTAAPHPEIRVESVPDADGETKGESDQLHTDDDDDAHRVEEFEPHQPGENQATEAPNDTNETDQSDFKAVPHEDNDDNYVVVDQPDNGTDAQEHEAAAAEEKPTEAQQVEDVETFQAKEEETQPGQEHEQEADTAEHSALYPVKVYYQDNEISLFPPREGDSSETFFLEDESLAYEPLGKLFASCRKVLRDHVGENEVLVMDIDSLNIQLTEDSVHISKVTLSQVVDLYLHLCHNDGVDEPEALYLTLSTKLTIPAEVSDLLLAASEGKGLSEIHSWDDYQEVDVASADAGARGEGQVPEEPHDETSPAAEDHQSTEAAPETGSQVAQPEESTPDTAPNEDKSEPEKGVDSETQTHSGLHAQDHVSKESEAENDVQEVHPSEDLEHEDENYNFHDQEGLEDPSYDSEAHHTESTATIAQLPATESKENQQSGEEDDVAGDDHGRDGAHDEFYDPESVDDEFAEEAAHQNVTEHESVKPAEEADSGEVYDHDEAELHVEESYEEAPEEDDYHDHDAEDFTAENNDDYIEEGLLDEDGEDMPKVSEPLADQNFEEPAEPKSASSPTLAENSLGAADGHSKSPSSGSSEDGPGGIQTEAEPRTTESVIDHEHEELEFEDGELLDLGIPEEFEPTNQEGSAKPSGSASVKRQRDAEDEVEVAESPSPDAKRSRSS